MLTIGLTKARPSSHPQALVQQPLLTPLDGPSEREREKYVYMLLFLRVLFTLNSFRFADI